jgi:hypothetical protein
MSIKVVFIPPNWMSVIQVMEQAGISTSKICFLKKTFGMLLKAVDYKSMTVKEFWKVLLLEMQ